MLNGNDFFDPISCLVLAHMGYGHFQIDSAWVLWRKHTSSPTLSVLVFIIWILMYWHVTITFPFSTDSFLRGIVQLCFADRALCCRACRPWQLQHCVEVALLWAVGPAALGPESRSALFGCRWASSRSCTTLIQIAPAALSSWAGVRALTHQFYPLTLAFQFLRYFLCFALEVFGLGRACRLCRAFELFCAESIDLWRVWISI